MLDSLKILFTHGGLPPYINVGVSALAIAIMIERFITLTKYTVAEKPFMDQLEKLVKENQIDRARKLCQAAPNSVLARVMLAGLDRANHGEAEVSAAIEERVLEITPLVSKRTPSLFPLANIATLIGLIGTILGLIKTFAAIGSAAPEMKAQLLSIGISEAMYNTAFGLVVAVACISAQLFLGNKVKELLEEIEYNAIKLENLLSRRAAGEIGGEKAA